MTTARKRTATRPGVPLLRMLATRRTLCSARRKTPSLFCPVSNCTALYANSEAAGKATGSQSTPNRWRRNRVEAADRIWTLPTPPFRTGWRVHSEVLPAQSTAGATRIHRSGAAQTRKVCPWVFHRNGEQIQVFRRNWKTACKNAGCAGRTLTTSAAQPCATWCAPAFRNGWP